mmetsp:Transcript_14418/g.21917  ORF Transcript_14418/g.21917 Transcript_14418/m.21917 type:complete len:244 (-) Transcript_14418:158-889(-)|eukprot:CAMPEP_0167753876 /NCGR_PEP_ID=MMETSP0110_2-20121227/7960_1 /TAXON_ID=629695 /ORGANISM="Gymnochlora sp., Strain CCMP2014" /LENGTH=243 /DNA_ID=CAMNT_0007639697 /DNA_START=25 /DNA_END=756 /DNA_ORIENTATION=-
MGGNSSSKKISLADAIDEGSLDKKACEELFEHYDKDNSGKIEKNEIQHIVADIIKIKHKGDEKTLKEIDEMVKLGGFVYYEKQLFQFFDKGDKDGKIDKSEFVANFPKYVKALLNREKTTLGNLSKAVQDGILEGPQCKELFKHYDADNSGMIERKEVSKIVGDILILKGQDKKEVHEMIELGGLFAYENQFFSFFDTGVKDGKVDEKEFLAKFPQYVKALTKTECKSSEKKAETKQEDTKAA